jgi:hypothetical protein
MVAEGMQRSKDRLPGQNRRDAGVKVQQVSGGASLLRRRILIIKVDQDSITCSRLRRELPGKSNSGQSACGPKAIPGVDLVLECRPSSLLK